MRTILVPTDFSAIATNALHYAIEMANTIKANLMLLHVYQVPVSYTDAPIVMVSVDELRHAAEKRMEQLKEMVRKIVRPEQKIYTETRLGNITDELESICEKIKPFAVVMGTKGASAFERVVFGSNTLSAIRHLHVPVICVPPGKTFGKGIKKIGFACDCKEVVATTPTRIIRDLVKNFDAELHVLNVNTDGKREEEKPEQTVLLETLLSDLHPEYHFLEHTDIEDAINEFAEKNNLDLVISIPKQHKLVEKIFRKSSTRQLVYESHVPVMCIHEE
ncbi:MAG: universal stress protein [Chitinophagales bacterium]|jgi:nucleotide-binding universal stress UspA family protein|nr:universal stress protein [Chitinophagales bacterium]